MKKMLPGEQSGFDEIVATIQQAISEGWYADC
jgi:hypothetical protein